MNVSVEPMEAHKEGENQYCAVPGYTFLKPGSDRVKVMIKNLTARTIKVSQGSKVASMEAANIVPHLLAPQETTSVRSETNIMKSANVEVSQRDLPTTIIKKKPNKLLQNEAPHRWVPMMWVHQRTPSRL